MYRGSTGYSTIVTKDMVPVFEIGGLYNANDIVPLYDSVTGIRSEARAYEILQKRWGDETGRWYTATEIVTVFNAETGETSQCYAWELYGKRVGDETGQWYTAEDYVSVYSQVQGKTVYVCADNVKEFKTNDAIQYSKTRHTQRDSGLIGVPDAEISRRAHDNSLPSSEKQCVH